MILIFWIFLKKLKLVFAVSALFHDQEMQIKNCLDFHLTLLSVVFKYRGFITNFITFLIGMVIIDSKIEINNFTDHLKT